MLDAIFKPFAEQCPVCVMAVAAARRLLGHDRLDRLFGRAKVGQHVHQLMFADLFDLMAAVVSGSRRSIHHAYQSSGIGVSAVAVYGKLNGIEPPVCRALVRETAAEVATLMAGMPPAEVGRRGPVLAGYRTRVLDGNAIAATEHRVGPLRGTSAGPLPGKSLVVLDADRRVIRDLFPCPDGHAQERSILPQVYPTVEPGELWVADRNFCTAEFLAEVSARGACLVVRRHGNMAVRPTADRVRIGRCDTGTVYEQPVVVVAAAAAAPDGTDGTELPLRMVTVELDKGTRDGDATLTLLANLPPSVDAVAVAEVYRGRWQIETAFGELATHLNSEIDTPGYPGAALFAFAVAVTLYNAVALMNAALAARHGDAVVDEDVSGYYVAADIAATTKGMLIAVPPHHWDAFETMPAAAFAAELVALAGRVNLSHYRKHPRGPKRPRPPRVHDRASPHVSTHKLLEERKAKRKQAAKCSVSRLS